MNNLLLMMKDIPVMRVNFDYGIYDIMSEKYLPYQLQGKVKECSHEENSNYGRVQQRICERNNYDAIITFLSSRVLPLDRCNAKKVINLLRMDQSNSPVYRTKIAIMCKAVSLQDKYWIKMENDNSKWKDIDLQQNKLSEIVAQVALHGSSLTLEGRVSTPELTTQGSYAKCWKREKDGLYLYKRGWNGDDESRIEIEVSNILDKCNVRHLKYEKTEDNGIYCCKCKCMTDDRLSILSGSDFISYCNVNNIDWYKKALEIDSDLIYKMFIVDYLVSNRDRHSMNWGFWYDCNTMEILKCHPLYDHNNSFDRETMMNSEGGDCLLLNGKSLREAALMAIKRVDFKFIESITRDDFIVESHYKSFKERASILGLM